MLTSLILALVLTLQPVAPDPCETTVPPFVVTSGSAYWITWVLPATVSTPQGPVPQRINGFTLQIDATPKLDLGALVPGAPCPAGTPQAGKLPFVYRTLSGVARGSHTATLIAWNFTLDASGNPTTTKQESGPLTIPFAAVDPILTGPPSTPEAGAIKR